MSAVLHKLLDAGDLDALQREIEKAKNASSDPFSQFFVGTPPLQEKDDVDCVVPLTLAIMMRNVAAVRLLLEAKADVNRKCNGSSTLHAALLLGYYSNHRETAVEILGLLLDENPEVNVKDDRGETPLHQGPSLPPAHPPARPPARPPSRPPCPPPSHQHARSGSTRTS